MALPFPLEIGQTYYSVGYAEAKMTMPSLTPLVYIGRGEARGDYWFQDTISYMLYGSLLENGGDQPDDMRIEFFAEKQLGVAVQTLAQAVAAVNECERRAVELGYPKMPVSRNAKWVTANPPPVWDTLINVDVPDLEAAIRFYTEGLGLTVRRRLFDDTVAEMDGASCSLYLLAKDACSAALPQGDTLRNYGRHWTPVHLDFVVKKIEPAVQKLIAAGAKLETGPTDFVWGRQATFSDPFGHGICLVQWLGKGYGEVA